MTENNTLTRAETAFMPLYPWQNIVIEKGEGCRLYDTEGKSYLDFAAGIAVAALGHQHPVFNKAVEEQLNKFTICPASYATEPRVNCGEYLSENSCCDQVYLCNSGAEAVEAAYKLAKKWAYETKGEDCNEVIVFDHAFHGRTMGAASLTYKREYQPFYGPYLGGVHEAKFNDIDSVKALISDKTAAIMVEPIQGEGGVVPAEQSFMEELRALCDEHNIALIFDEIQCGMGRTGTFFAYEQFGVEPDIITLAKGMGGGIPVGAMIAKQKFAESFNKDSHGTTYGGNPLSANVAYNVMKTINTPEMLAHVNEISTYLMDGLQNLKQKTNQISDIRGKGLMIGIDVTPHLGDLRKDLQNAGLMTTAAGAQVLRFTPPLIVTKEEVDEALNILETTLKNIE